MTLLTCQCHWSHRRWWRLHRRFLTLTCKVRWESFPTLIRAQDGPLRAITPVNLAEHLVLLIGIGWGVLNPIIVTYQDTRCMIYLSTSIWVVQGVNVGEYTKNGESGLIIFCTKALFPARGIKAVPQKSHKLHDRQAMFSGKGNHIPKATSSSSWKWVPHGPMWKKTSSLQLGTQWIRMKTKYPLRNESISQLGKLGTSNYPLTSTTNTDIWGLLPRKTNMFSWKNRSWKTILLGCPAGT